MVFHLTRVFVHTVLQLPLMPCARPCLPSHVREGRLGAIAMLLCRFWRVAAKKITFLGPPLSLSISALAVVRARPLCKNVDFILLLPLLLLLLLLLLMPLHTVRARPNSVRQVGPEPNWP